MRSRRELQRKHADPGGPSIQEVTDTLRQAVILEVLLDIRDLLSEFNKKGEDI